MTEDREALISEIQRLQKSRRRWRTVALASLALVFLVMLPFSIAIDQLMGPLVTVNHSAPKRIPEPLPED
jgi:hypothetical protein